MTKLLRLLCLLVPLLFAACKTTGRPMDEVADEINRFYERKPLRVEPGDTVDLSFPFKQEWNHSVRVRPDGRASFLLVGEVRVAGLSVGELQEVLAESYRNSSSPQEISVNVVAGAPRSGSDVGGTSVYVMGEVRTPGAQNLDGRSITLVEAIGRAGGPIKNTARMESVLFVRRLQEGRVVSWVVDSRVELWGTAAPIYLQPNDVVFVPNTNIDDANIFVEKYIRQMLPFPYLVPGL
ncbi:MAG: hypothetical protein RL148_905 [Planctomycetota bacterium]